MMSETREIRSKGDSDGTSLLASVRVSTAGRQWGKDKTQY
jgi:hypothetical protein